MEVVLRDLGTTAQANEFLRAFFGDRNLVIIEASEMDVAKGLQHENSRLKVELEAAQRESAGLALKEATLNNSLAAGEDARSQLEEDLRRSRSALAGTACSRSRNHATCCVTHSSFAVVTHVLGRCRSPVA